MNFIFEELLLNQIKLTFLEEGSQTLRRLPLKDTLGWASDAINLSHLQGISNINKSKKYRACTFAKALRV